MLKSEKRRPVFFNPVRIQMPVGALTSITHRVTGIAHIWVGVRDVTLDYIRPVAMRVLALALLAAGLMGMGAWVIRILWPGRA